MWRNSYYRCCKIPRENEAHFDWVWWRVSTIALNMSDLPQRAERHQSRFLSSLLAVNSPNRCMIISFFSSHLAVVVCDRFAGLQIVFLSTVTLYWWMHVPRRDETSEQAANQTDRYCANRPRCCAVCCECFEFSPTVGLRGWRGVLQ